MADNLTTATIDVRANTRGMERDILKALQTVELSQINTKKSSQALGRITGQVSEFNKSLEASNARVIAFGASAGAIFAVEKALTSLISSTIEVEKKLADINVLLGLSSSNLEKFGNSLFDVAKNTAQSFSAVADAATELSRQGLGVEETLKRTNAALILTRLSGLDAKSSVEALTATLNSFSGSALDAVEVVNKLANVDAAFAVSSADLANAISRVGSTAVDAGVSLDELIALVTSAQQTTARGGAVIGNSFKTIFTRLQRSKVQDLLGSLGVDTTEGQSAISLLQQLATTYDQLGSVQKSYIAEQVGGVFQINILKAALSDLGKEYSIYGRALETSLSSTDQAIQRNKLLNQTVAALSSQAVSNLEQAANKIGTIVFEPNAKGFLSGFNNLLESFNNIDAESAGGKLMTGFFKGIGDFIGGPGAVLATAVLVKLFARLTQFAAGSAKELLGTNKAAQQQAAIEQSILSILQKNSQFTSQILAGKMTTVQAEKQMLDYLTAQSNILREQERLSKVIGANLAMKGVSIGASGIPMTAPAKKTKAAASGYIPNFATDMAVGQAMENAGAREHGYRAGKAKKTTIHDGNGKSFKSFVNNKEDVKTFTNAAGKKATVVRPPNGFGENTQYAAGGYIPNFANSYKYSIGSFAGGKINNPNAKREFNSAINSTDSEKYKNIERDDKISSVGFKIEKIPISSILNQELNNQDDKVRSKATLDFEKEAIRYLSSRGESFLPGSEYLYGGSRSSVDGFNLVPGQKLMNLLEVKSGKWNPLEVGNKFGRFIPENIANSKNPYVSKTIQSFFTEGVKDQQDIIKLNSILAVPDNKIGNSFIRKKGKKEIDSYSSFSTKSIASRIKKKKAETEKGGQNRGGSASGFVPNFASMGSKFKAMYGGGTTMRATDKEKTAKKKNLDVKKLDLSDRYTMVHGGNQGLSSADVSLEAGNKLFDAKIATAGLNTAGTNLQRYGIKGVVGDALVSATNNIIKTFGGTEQITDASSLDNAGSVGSAAGTVFETALRKAFNAPAISQTQRIDFPAPTPELKKFFHNAPGQYEAKISRTPDNLKSALKKWVDVNGLASSSSSGFVPNFAKSGLSFSHKDKDEFGFSEIQAIMSGKRVGSFSYAEDKKGLVDVGDFSVNKGERGKGIGTELYKEAIRRNAGKKMRGQLLPQMNRLLQKIKNGEPVSAETLYPQIKRADLAKSSVFEVYGHKGMTVEKMTRDQFASFVNAKISELKKDPKKLQSYFGNVEADEYGGLGVDLQTQHASGFVPNFSNALNDAIAREQSSGLSKSQIYVDSHSSLKNKNNPMGLMVANRRDEPSGGIQGIKRAKKEGRNPKTYGGGMSSGFVPNFAANDPGVLEGMIGKAVGGDGSEIESGRKAVEKSLKKFPELGSEFERVAKQFEGLNSDVDDWIKKIRELNSSASKSQAPSQGGEANINASQLSGREIVFSRAGTPDKEKAAAKTRDRRAEAEYKAQRAAEGEGSYQTFAMSGPTPSDASAKKSRKQRSLDYLRGGGSILGGKAKDSMLGKGMGYLKGNSMGIGFGLQAAAGMAGEYAGNDDTQTGRGIKAGAGALGDIASFAGTGAMIAGPYGALAGALVGAAKGAVDMHKALTTKVPDLEKALQASSDAANRFGESGQKLLMLNEQYGDAMMSGNPAQAADIMIKTQQAYAEELSKLTEVQRSSMISAIAQGKGQEEYAKILGEMQNSVKAQETATQLTKFSESGGIFSGPDKKLLAGMDKGLALDFTKGMDTASITAALEKSASSLGNANLGTENQALDLMKNLASSDSLTGDQKENLNKMIEAFASAAQNTDLSKVSEAFIKSIKDKPKSDADVKKAQQAAKAELEARAAKAKKEIEIREKTNAMLIKLQSDTEAVYQRYNSSMEDFISSIQTASEMMGAAGQFREEYLVQSGANKNITDPIKEKNIVNKSNADLKVAVYKSQLDTGKNFNEGVKSLLSGLETDSAKLGVGESATDQSNQLLDIKSRLEQALLPVQEMITGGNYEGAKSKTQEVFDQLKPEERTAIGEDKIVGAVKQLESGIDQGARNQDLLVKNSQKDLAIQAQQLIFQKAMTKLTQAQNFGGTTSQILGDTEDSPFNKAIEAVTNAKIMGYNQKGLQPGSVSAVEGGDRNSFGVDGKKPSIGTAEQIVNFYKAAGEIGGESVMSTESKDFAVLTQAIREQTRKKLDELRGAGEGVVDPAVFTRLETTLATLGGGDQVAQLKLMKELGFANISGKKITDTAMKGYSGGAFAGLDPALKKGFEATSDEGASATFLLLADQQKQTASILQGQTAQTDSLNQGL
jgi:TP901 family phage tail tape measure protein